MKQTLLFVGINAPKQLIQNTCNKILGKNVYEYQFVDHYAALKNFSFDNNTGKKIAAIFLGPVPHKSTAGSGHASMASPDCINNIKIPVYVLRTDSGQIKFSKSSLKKALHEFLEVLHTTVTL